MMLSAFKPQTIIELKQQDKSKIESLIAYGDRILVGLNTGVLRIYRVLEEELNRNEDDVGSSEGIGGQPKKSRAVELLSEKEKFSRKPILQLAVIRESNVLISLSDGFVTFHDLQTFEVTERLDKTKGASAFAATSNIVRDESTGIASIVSRLAVTVKRNIYIWTWQDMELVGAAKELTLPGAIKSLTWMTDNRIVAGMDPGFALIEVTEMKWSEIHRQALQGELGGSTGTRFGAVNSTAMGYVGMSGWIPKPLSTKLFGDQMLLAKDVNSLFIDSDGKSLDKRQIPWRTSPDAIAYSYPYLLSLQSSPKTGLEVRNTETLNLLQSLPLSGANILHVPHPGISLAHAGRGFLVASERAIWRMNAVDYDLQIDELAEKHRYDEALSLMLQLEDTLLNSKAGRVRDVQILKARSLFESQKYRPALDLFIDAAAPPDVVIELYPSIIAGTASKHAVRKTSNGATKSDGQELSTVEGSPPLDSILRSQKSLADAGSTNTDGGSSSAAEVSATLVDTDDDSRTAMPLEGKNLTLAVRMLQPFLVETRTKLRNFINSDGRFEKPIRDKMEAGDNATEPDFVSLLNTTCKRPGMRPDEWEQGLHETAVLVDTTLFRAYMFAHPGMVGPLLRLDNFCDPGVVRELLEARKSYDDLIDFLHAKKRFSEVLELLEKFGKNEEALEENEAFVGPRKMVNYLQQLPFEMVDTILRFARWPMQEDPKLGMRVFLAETENAERLQRDKVLDFLQGVDQIYVLQYLEHIVGELDDDTPEFHEQLLSIYMEELKLSTISSEDVKKKLEDHLTHSDSYNKKKALEKLPQSDSKFYEARVILLRRLSRHLEALSIYVYEIEDYQKADEYCNQVYLSQHTTGIANVDPDNPDQAHTVYTLLLSLYLTPPSGHQTNLDAALELLSRHGSRLPALNTLNVLPMSLPIKDLESYFRGRMRNATSWAREEAMIAAMSKMEKFETELDLLFGENQEDTFSPIKNPPQKGKNGRIVINENTLCKVCHKRFGRLAVRVWPNGDILHFACSRRNG